MVTNGLLKGSPNRPGTRHSIAGNCAGRLQCRLWAGGTSRQIVYPPNPLPRVTANPQKEPNELLKTNHLKNDRMTDANGCLIRKDLGRFETRFGDFAEYLS